MNHPPTPLRIVLTSVALWATGCTMLPPPPSIAPKMPRRSIIPRSYRMKLAVFNLQDPTRSGGKLSERVAEALHVALFETERFELMQRAELRGIDPGDTRRIQEEYRYLLDGLVVGSITHFNTAQKTMTLNINVMNPLGNTVAAKSFDSIRYTGTINVNVSREDIERIAEWIDRKFPKLDSGQVLSRSSRRQVTLNLGSQDGVQIGMGVLLAARGDDIKDPATGDLLGSNIYVGEAYVVAVDAATCEATLENTYERKKASNGRLVMMEGPLPAVRVGDNVVFK